MKKTKKLVSFILVFAMAIGIATCTQAASREEIANIHVSKAGDFKYWADNSPAKQSLVNYVKDVTNKKSTNFIPVEDRIAVFDLDGTLICETTPSYFEWMMYLDRVLDDPTYNASQGDKDYAKVVKAAIDARHFPEDMDLKEAIAQSKAFAGMTFSEYENYVKKFMETPAEGLTNLKRGESFYTRIHKRLRVINSPSYFTHQTSGNIC